MAARPGTSATTCHPTAGPGLNGREPLASGRSLARGRGWRLFRLRTRARVSATLPDRRSGNGGADQRAEGQTTHEGRRPKVVARARLDHVEEPIERVAAAVHGPAFFRAGPRAG